MVQQDRFVGALPNRLLHREHVVQQVVGLDAGVDAAGMIPEHARHHDRDPVPQRHLRRVGVGAGDDDDRGARTGGGVVGQLADATREEYPNGDFALRVDTVHRVQQPGFEVGVGRRYGQREPVGRCAQPGEMSVEQKRLAVVGAQGLIHAVAVEKPVVEHRDDRLVATGDDAVHVNRCLESFHRSHAFRAYRYASVPCQKSVTKLPCVF